MNSHTNSFDVAHNDLEVMYDCLMKSMTINARLFNGAVPVNGNLSRAPHVHGFASDGIPSASMASASVGDRFRHCRFESSLTTPPPPHSPEHIIFFTLA
jgi:hypothetical protein